MKHCLYKQLEVENDFNLSSDITKISHFILGGENLHCFVAQQKSDKSERFFVEDVMVSFMTSLFVTLAQTFQIVPFQ